MHGHPLTWKLAHVELRIPHENKGRKKESSFFGRSDGGRAWEGRGGVGRVEGVKQEPHFLTGPEAETEGEGKTSLLTTAYKLDATTGRRLLVESVG